MSIHPEFKKHFDDLEKRHLALYRRLNAVKQKGRELTECLDRELGQYSRWRFDLMDRLAETVAGFSDQQKERHQRYIKGTEYYRIVQEAPFYWRIMNKPEGYAGDAEMMNFIYRNRYEGMTPFGMLLHKAAVETIACDAVRNRRTYLREQILGVKNAGGAENPERRRRSRNGNPGRGEAADAAVGPFGLRRSLPKLS